jgi:hypothetical protein
VAVVVVVVVVEEWVGYVGRYLDLMAVFTVPPSVFEIPSPGRTVGARLAAREPVVAARGHGSRFLTFV